jgi:hypothetical protein
MHNDIKLSKHVIKSPVQVKKPWLLSFIQVVFLKGTLRLNRARNISQWQSKSERWAGIGYF